MNTDAQLIDALSLATNSGCADFQSQSVPSTRSCEELWYSLVLRSHDATASQSAPTSSSSAVFHKRHARHSSYDYAYGLRIATTSKQAYSAGAEPPPVNRAHSLLCPTSPAAAMPGSASSAYSIASSGISLSNSMGSHTSVLSDEALSSTDARKRASLDRKSHCSFDSYATSSSGFQDGASILSMDAVCNGAGPRPRSKLESLLPKTMMSWINGSAKQPAGRPEVSTTGLILQDRPQGLPAKTEAEMRRHQHLYEQILECARRREQKDAKLQRKKSVEQRRHEDSTGAAIADWEAIIPRFHRVRHEKRVRNLWWNGLPPCKRGLVWSLSIGNDLNITPELCDIYLLRAAERFALIDSTNNAQSNGHIGEQHSTNREKSLETIPLDVSRTFPTIGIYQKGGPFHDKLLTLLGAYVLYRPDVGYVQGMSFLGAIILLYLESREAFVCFANLLNRPCQMSFYHLQQEKMHQYYSCFDRYLFEQLPKLHAHLALHGVTADLYLVDWFYTMYAKALPLDTACRVWDLFARDGEEFLFRAGLGILRLLSDTLLGLDSFDSLVYTLTHIPDTLRSDTLFDCIAAHTPPQSCPGVPLSASLHRRPFAGSALSLVRPLMRSSQSTDAFASVISPDVIMPNSFSVMEGLSTTTSGGDSASVKSE